MRNTRALGGRRNGRSSEHSAGDQTCRFAEYRDSRACQCRSAAAFLSVITDGGILQPVLVDATVAARMVRPYAWLLDRVGAGGVKFTSAGYLPPVHVEAAIAELGLAGEWARAYNREAHMPPVL